MAPQTFRQYLYPVDDPKLAEGRDLSPLEFTALARTDPEGETTISEWVELFETTRFHGITTDGAVTPGLWKPGGDERSPRAAASAAAVALLDGLDEDRRRRLVHPLDSAVWRAWMNPELYLNPYGLRLEELDAEDAERAMLVLRAVLSEAGYEKVRTLMQINGFLGDLVQLPRIMNGGSYNLNLFGDPSGDGPWGLNFYGHHVCLNTIFIGDQQFFTPVFLGAEPDSIDEGADATATSPFSVQEFLAPQLMRELAPELRDEAILHHLKRDPDMPAGRLHLGGDELILGGAFQDNRVIPYEGVQVARFSAEQQETVLQIVESFLDYQPDGPRAARLAEIRAHLDETWLCWIGGTSDEDVFYYRIQSPVIMVEFDHHAGVFLANPEPERFHIHTMVRTPNGNDYGVALLRQLGYDTRLDGPAD